MGGDGHLYGSVAAAKEAGISLRQLYHWVDTLQVVQPQVHQHGSRAFRRFSAADVEQLRKMRDLVVWGYTLQAAAGIVKGDREPS